MLLSGTRIAGRAFGDAYKQALANSAAARAAAGNMKAVTDGDKMTQASGITVDESTKILNIKDIHDKEELTKKFAHHFEANDPKKGGTLYLQSKVIRARERIEMLWAQEKLEAEMAKQEKESNPTEQAESADKKPSEPQQDDTQTIAAIFRNSGNAPAVLTTASSDPKDVTLAYADIKGQSERFRRQTEQLYGGQVPPGTVLSSLLPNGLTCLLVFLATTLQRATAAPLNPAMKQSEVEFYLEDAQSKVLIVPENTDEQSDGVQAARKLNVPVWTAGWEPNAGLRLAVLGGEAANPVALHTQQTADGPQPDDVALLLHTSGTTGRPKAVPLTHANIARSMANIAATYKLSADDRSFIVMPLFHVHGLIGAVLSSLYAGGSVVVPARFSASHFWPEFIASQSTWYSAVPTIHQILLRHDVPNPVPQIRFIRSCSSALAPTVLSELEAKLHAPVLEAYAMTEAAHQMCSNPLPPAQHKSGSVGLPQGVEVAILDDAGAETQLGEVCVRGPNVTHGYLNNAEANAKSFTPESHWFRTGDQGFLDSDGFLVLTGRIKELINRGGEKISPLELDAVLLKCPGVAEAVSFAVTDQMYGQEVNAAVVPKQGVELTEDQVKQFMSEQVANFKVPKRVFVSDDLPRTATGKIQRRVVAEHFAGPQ
ncbi:hypothetical protein GGH12_005990 [Coemansia sp. RSA 1822]|nr:hypothetical protein LPJ76_000313 [Coemansia sp. RSA 638]KAJ2558118.1 hypothetical protein GGH12_005990 [Coemansia sp. RSA 1822]